MSDVNNLFKVMIESERTANLFGSMIKKYLTSNHIASNQSQVYILHIIKQAGGSPTVGDIQNMLKGIMTNGSYNFNALFKNGYMLSTPNKIDKRSCYISLTPKGDKLYKNICDFMDNQIKSMEETIHWDKSNYETYLSDLSILQSFLSNQ